LRFRSGNDSARRPARHGDCRTTGARALPAGKRARLAFPQRARPGQDRLPRAPHAGHRAPLMSFLARRSGPPRTPKRRRALSIIALVVAALAGAHFGIGCAARLTRPDVSLPAGDARRVSANLRRFGASAVLERGRILEVYL